ncbi:hypothetical protein GCM10011371_30880 [Novosphingobium marinum]|uniref:DUF2170 family protein n=1 Tax=Novosphingobium marinum TaxID=1514948 RepID=A0A7Y9XUT3_9SPHN|nr:DUF2170 family protein [Novosphingobium marinum]NYH94959.1 hypothetical protein [Novosphingobium marinum]GGC41269.1 hypothetical protein GCM10011371_30880 [Novosphingobium marinum]
MKEDWPVPAHGWDISGMTELFASDPEALGDVDVTVEGESEVLRVTLKERGDLDVLLTASGEQILASVLIAPAADIPNRESFERMLLSVHKLIPLSTFGLTKVGGAEWYELFGSLSALSDAEALVEEVAVLAANAVDAAEWVGEWIEAGGDEARMGEVA